MPTLQVWLTDEDYKRLLASGSQHQSLSSSQWAARLIGRALDDLATEAEQP